MITKLLSKIAQAIVARISKPVSMKGAIDYGTLVQAAVMFLVVGIILVMGAYLNESFRIALNSTSQTVNNIFNAVTNFYNTFATFLTPLGLITLFVVIIGAIIFAVVYIRGVSGAVGG